MLIVGETVIMGEELAVRVLLTRTWSASVRRP